MRYAAARRAPGFFLVGTLLLAACGQTGPLYLPDHASPKRGLSMSPDRNDPALENAANSSSAKPKPPEPLSLPSASSVAAPAPGH